MAICQAIFSKVCNFLTFFAALIFTKPWIKFLAILQEGALLHILSDVHTIKKSHRWANSLRKVTSYPLIRYCPQKKVTYRTYKCTVVMFAVLCFADYWTQTSGSLDGYSHIRRKPCQVLCVLLSLEKEFIIFSPILM